MRVAVATAVALVVGVIALVGASVVVATVLDSPRVVQPSTPGGVRVQEDGQELFYTNYVQGTGHIEIAGAYTLRKTPLGIAIDVAWPGDTGHTWVDIRTHRVERHDEGSGRIRQR